MTADDLDVRLAGVILRSIPTHREPRMSVAQIAARAGADLPLTSAEVLAASQATVALLRTFGVLDENVEGVRAAGQMPAYFLNSLAWYVRNRAPMLDGWRDHQPLSQTGDAVTRGPNFLQRIEQRRQQLAEQRGIAATPSREQAAVLVLVKVMRQRRPHFLFQWDARASQLQLIGGRIEPGETPAQAAVREFQEEVGDGQSPRWQSERDYEITALALKGGPLALLQISPSYGALTAYTFHVFAVRIHAAQFTLNAGARWLDRADMLRGKTRDGLSMGEPALYRLLLGALAGIKRVPVSFTQQVGEHLVGVGE